VRRVIAFALGLRPRPLIKGEEGEEGETLTFFFPPN
jgi:hypothetical protein